MTASQHPGEGREDGWEEPEVADEPALREVVARAEAAGNAEWAKGARFATEWLRPFLAAARGEPGLDVERLVEALKVVTNERLFAGDRDGPKWRAKTAAKLAAEYNRLRREPDGTETRCPLEGVHEHVFRGPHRFREWEPGT